MHYMILLRNNCGNGLFFDLFVNECDRIFLEVSLFLPRIYPNRYHFLFDSNLFSSWFPKYNS